MYFSHASSYRENVASARTVAPLARKYTNRIFESKDGITTMKIVNYIERHNFCLNDLLTKSNRTEIQTYKVEERTSGTPCTATISIHLSAAVEQVFKIGSMELGAMLFDASKEFEASKVSLSLGKSCPG